MAVRSSRRPPPAGWRSRAAGAALARPAPQRRCRCCWRSEADGRHRPGRLPGQREVRRRARALGRPAAALSQRRAGGRAGAGSLAPPAGARRWTASCGSGRGRFDALSRPGAPRRAATTRRGAQLRYMVFDLPGAPGRFADRARRRSSATRRRRALAASCRPSPQRRLAEPAGAAATGSTTVVRAGGEGLMLHRADAPYADRPQPRAAQAEAACTTPRRSSSATCRASGRHAGRLGALRVRTRRRRRVPARHRLQRRAARRPAAAGQRRHLHLPRARRRSGVPRFASFLRVRPDA